MNLIGSVVKEVCVKIVIVMCVLVLLIMILLVLYSCVCVEKRAEKRMEEIRKINGIDE